MITEPMLAETPKSLDEVRYPVLATPKLDGVRFIRVKDTVLFRSFKEISNKYVVNVLTQTLPDGTDGELIVPGADFHTISSICRRSDGCGWYKVEPRVFDYVKDSLYKPYKDRMDDLTQLEIPGGYKLLPVLIHTKEELLAYAEAQVVAGYEGAIFRDPEGWYKNGRSTAKEGLLLRWKPFVHSEAIILDILPKMRNDNPQEKDNFGRAKRSSHKANKVAVEMMGSMKVREIETGIEFSIGTGWTRSFAMEVWFNKDEYLGQIAKFKYQKYGTKDKPRIPVFEGIRAVEDM